MKPDVLPLRSPVKLRNGKTITELTVAPGQVCVLNQWNGCHLTFTHLFFRSLLSLLSPFIAWIRSGETVRLSDPSVGWRLYPLRMLCQQVGLICWPSLMGPVVVSERDLVRLLVPDEYMADVHPLILAIFGYKVWNMFQELCMKLTHFLRSFCSISFVPSSSRMPSVPSI